jgi:hypothetical protein
MKESMSESSRDTARDSIIITSPEGTHAAKGNGEKDFHSNIGAPPQTKCPDEKLGFIMCECGLEGISLKV